MRRQYSQHLAAKLPANEVQLNKHAPRETWLRSSRPDDSDHDAVTQHAAITERRPHRRQPAEPN